MALIRSKHSFDDHFTQIPNDWLRDKRLNLATIGLLAQIMSHKPGWSITLENLALANDVGRDAIRTCINQLLEVGYLVRSEERERNSKGQVAGYKYMTQDPTQVEPTLEKPTQEKLPLKKTSSLEEQFIEDQVIETYSGLTFETNSAVGDLFDDFWSIYPRKTGKGAARKAWLKAINNVGAGIVLNGAQLLANDPNLPEPQFIPHPATWLNEERWDDEPYAPRKTTAIKQEKNAEAAAKFLEAFKTPTHEITENPDWA